MSLGFRPYILKQIKLLMQENYPGLKITPAGFMKMVIDNNPNLDISSINGTSVGPGMKLNTTNGQVDTVKVKYKPRITPKQIQTEDDCDNDMMFQYKESDINAPRFAKFSFYKDWGFLERYEREAVESIAVGNPRTPILMEVFDDLMHTVNGLIGAMDNQLLTDVNWGVNQVTGLATATAININKDASVLDLQNGLVKVISDAQLNEMNGRLLMAGNGNMNRYEILKATSGLDSAGLDRSKLDGYSWNNDINSITNPNWGANAVGVFSPGSVGFVDLDRYIAWKSGTFGTSEFFTIPLPVQNGDTVTMVNFNVQIKQIDCPTEIYDGYTTRKVDRGYQFIVTKQYGLWQPPTDMFQVGDRLYGTNGSLLYTVANDCDPCTPAV